MYERLTADAVENCETPFPFPVIDSHIWTSWFLLSSPYLGLQAEKMPPDYLYTHHYNRLSRDAEFRVGNTCALAISNPIN